VSEQAVATAQGGLARAEESLAVAIAADGPVTVAKGEPVFDTPKPDEALKTAETVRRDVKAAQVRADVAHGVTTLDWTEYVPLMSAVFQPFTQNPPSLVQPQFGWQAQAVLTVPFYEGGLRYGQMHERRALADSADAQLENTLRQAKSEVRAAFEAVKHADEALLAARESAKQAAEALDLANVSYQAGATTNLEVIDAERRARDAETQVAVAEDAARQARLDVLAASGRFP
jgi:outer membrane protein TolC